MAKSPTAEDWVPAVCTLPTVEQPLRLAEFDAFFRTAVQRRSARTTTLDLVILPESEGFARDLAERETSLLFLLRFDFDPAERMVWRCGSAFQQATSMSSTLSTAGYPLSLGVKAVKRRCLRTDYAAARSPMLPG